MSKAEAREARRLLRLGLEQYGMTQADLVDHECLKWSIHAGSSRPVACPCRAAFGARGKSVAAYRVRARKVVENALREGKALSRPHASRLLWLLLQSKKSIAWHRAADPTDFRDPYREGLLRFDPTPAHLEISPPPAPVPGVSILPGAHALLVEEIVDATVPNRATPRTRNAQRTKVAALLERRAPEWERSYLLWMKRTAMQFAIDAWDDTAAGREGAFPAVTRTQTTRVRLRIEAPDPRKTREATLDEAVGALLQSEALDEAAGRVLEEKPG